MSNIQTQPQQQLISTTAPNKIFSSREELAEHYKSDWHRYNLKRKEAGLTPVNEEDFKARLEAAMALRKEREGREAKDGKDHLKDKSSQRKKGVERRGSETEQEKGNKEEEEEPPEIDPLRSLFDDKLHPDLETNVEYMHSKYGFFVPDREYLMDLEGFLGYCAEKVKLGRICLYCQKAFSSYQANQRHMIAKSHCKVKYEEGIDLDEYEVFYDFEKANQEFYGGQQPPPPEPMEVEEKEGGGDEDSEGEWTDVSDDEDDDYNKYLQTIQTQGFGVSELGELILPNGRIVGHRAFSRYYNQNFAPQTDKMAVQAQRQVERERILGYGTAALTTAPTSATNDLMKIGGRTLQARGREGNGILVKDGNGFTSISIYRYRAALRKARLEEARGFRLEQKHRRNMNRMDKKANRLMNGVSVAHAPR